MNQEFIRANREFWSGYQPKQGGGKILIEEPSIPMINHVNAIFSLILNQALSLTPVWLCNNDKDVEYLKSYVPTAEFIKRPRLGFCITIKVFFYTILSFTKIFFMNDILSFYYSGVKYGDIVYDSHLLKEQIATIKRVNFKLLRIIYSCIRRHEVISGILKSDNFSGVMVGHQVGVYSGVMLRAAVCQGYKGYLRICHHKAVLVCLEKKEEVYNCPLKPFPENIDKIISTLGEDFNAIFDAVHDTQTSGKGDKEGRYAFFAENKLYKDKNEFASDFGLDKEKKNIFVMLHAFNDYPHSHRWLLFKDYFSWFIETLEFAKSDKSVNWIFKQHPAIRFYPTKDVSFGSLFADKADNIVYIGEDRQIDTRSLIYCADLVVTCLGSAGFELPAMGGIPAITAGDNFYSGLGFTMEPKTKEEYFDLLRQAKAIPRLSLEQQKMAKASYMYIYEFSRMDVAACPPATFEEEKDEDQGSWYWGRVEDLYKTQEPKIKEQVRGYIREIGKPEFKRLTSLEAYCQKNRISNSCIKV